VGYFSEGRELNYNQSSILYGEDDVENPIGGFQSILLTDFINFHMSLSNVIEGNTAVFILTRQW
jgi:hypothetical protein